MAERKESALLNETQQELRTRSKGFHSDGFDSFLTEAERHSKGV